MTPDSQNFDKVVFVLLDSNNNPTSSKYNMAITVIDTNTISVSPAASYLPAGTYRVLAHKALRGYSRATP